jgi:hypothetical protein
MAVTFKVGDKIYNNAQYDIYGTRLARFTYNHSIIYTIIRIGGRGFKNDDIIFGLNGVVTAVVKMSQVEHSDGRDKKTPAVTPVAPKVTTPAIADFNANDLANKILNKVSRNSATSYGKSSLSGSGVQQVGSRGSKANPNTDEYYKLGFNDAIYTNEHNVNVEESAPSIIQNGYNFPPVAEKAVVISNGSNGTIVKSPYKYSYYMNYDTDSLNGTKINADINDMYKALNIDIRDRQSLYKLYTQKYDKYKIGNPNDRLSKSFAHVFFVRPDCNLLSGSAANPTLKKTSTAGQTYTLANFSEFYYAYKHCPDILKQLTQKPNFYGNQFMMYLSNKARTFEVADEYLDSDTYGTGLTGYKIPYGRTNVESRTSGKFTINYIDDRDLHVYNLHKLWTDYISYVYRGKLIPRKEYMTNKVIDYATCVYYILCAEDGETIIFWSKYWGVFPLDSPSSAFSYDITNNGGVKDPEVRIEYQYAWKEDFNPLSLVEFNMHSNTSESSLQYVNTYQNSKLGTGYTWGGAPFIETFNGTGSDRSVPYTFKLRFRPES